MWKKRLPALVLAGALTAGLPALAAETPADPAAPAPTPVEYAAQYGGATSIQYAIWQDGAVTQTGRSGVYSKSENRALTDDILYGLGSVSKVYTTAAVMKLAEAGKLGLDKPVTAYLPDFKMADERYKDITVRMLLNHSSGLMGSSTENAFLFGDTDRSATTDLLERLSTQRLKADPGAYSVYCNDGFTLAELVVEAVSGQSFGDYLHQAVLSPAGLEDTFVPSDAFDTSRLAKTYASADDVRALPQDVLGIVGAGGVYATASDLAAFGGALTGTGILSAASTAAMAAPEYKNGIWPEDDADVLSYGLGWDSVKVYPFALDDIQALNKGGDTLYYHAALVVIPAYHMAAAVLSSGGVSTYNSMAANQLLIAALAEQGVAVTQTAPALPQAKPADLPAGLSQYAGYYGSTLQQMEVALGDSALTLTSLTVPSTPEQVYGYYDDGTFRDESGQGALLKFVEEDNGQTYLYEKTWADLPGLGLLPVSDYLGVKMPENKPTAAAQAAWDEIDTSDYLLVSEKYTSQLWPIARQSGGEIPKTVPGYQGAARIVDGNILRYDLQVPGNYGRDGKDSTRFTTADGVAALDYQGTVYLDAAAAVKPLYGGAGASSTIQPDGYARWYQVGALAGRRMDVILPEQGGFTVYDAAGAATAASVAFGDTGAVLPEGGSVVFVGAPGSTFELAFSQ